MKIAILVHDHHRAGGHSRYVAELATRFAQQHEVHIFANTYITEPGIVFHHVPANRSNALALILSFRHNATRLLQSMRFDIVHDQGLCTAAPDILTAHISNRAWARARPEAPLKEKLFSRVVGCLEHWQYARAGNVRTIAVSQRVRRDLASDYALHRNVSVIHHGVDANRFTPAHRSSALRAELGIPAGQPLYLFVGDFRKGVLRIIQALETGHLLCVGSTPPEAYRALAQKLNRADRVHFRPATDTIETIYAGADVLVHPTPYDAFGMVVLEAMAAGLPVVVSENAGAAELIENGRNGFLILQRATEPLAETMRAAAASNVGPAARETALEHSWDRVAEETLAVYRQAAQRPRLLLLATQGTGGNDEARLQTLVRNYPSATFPFHATRKHSTALRLLRTLWQSQYPLVIMEGTGTAGGVPLLLARAFFGQRYVVSTGDAVGPFLSKRHPWLAPVFSLYERLLYRWSAGVVGWSPYLTGRALTFGAPRAVTAAGWAPTAQRSPNGPTIRRQLGIPADALVIGIAGSLAWTPSVGYCYGYELVRAAAFTKRPDVRFLIVGDGTGRPHIERFPNSRIILTGFVERSRVPDYLAAMDVASLPQSCDGVGSFRYTTKLSEYLAAGLPVIMGQTPASYDLDTGWIWRLPGDAPWHEPYLQALGKLIDSLTRESIAAHRPPATLPEFDREAQIHRITQFLSDLCA